ncbi:isoamylase early set domain-containing protein [Gemmatimonas sp.]|uniref:isoamylase early set domain-containing protein n=1 Tax=Gemmatimonas sp. TaxID=1962908 RepID=UPI0022C93D83|nr:isoamylase early set domain-containing protein [Gemmatimonas sp.]MCZ8204234.1 isoamylase early set domain-containing protein [Gemmatimonas sp.]
MTADDRHGPAPEGVHDLHDLHDPYAEAITARLRRSYEAQAPHGGEHVAQVVRAVIAAAAAAAAPAAAVPRAAPSAGVSSRTAPPRWWWGAAAAAVLMIVVARPWRPDVHQREADSALAVGGARSLPSPAAPAAPAAREGTVRFTLSVADNARAVALVGDFNGWDTAATPMVQQGTDGSWTAQVPLEPGRHEYAFVVDGERWLVDPLAPQVENAGFGPTNAMVVNGRGGK